MTIPNVNLSILDGGLGIIPANVDGAHVLLGACSLGVPAAFYGFSDPQAMRTALGVGPLVECGAYEMTVAGGPVYFVPINPSVAGVAGRVTQGGPNSTKTARAVVAYQPSSGAASTSSVTHTGTGTGVGSVSGTPLDNYDVIFVIVASGSQTTATYKYSLDGGVTYSGVLTAAASNVLAGTGLTVALTGGGATYVASDIYEFTSVVHAPTGPATVVTVTGTPSTNVPANDLGVYDAIVKIALGGTVGVFTFQLSLDGGLTYSSGTITSAATYLIPGTGLTLNFAAGTYVATDLYAFKAVATSAGGIGTVAVSGSPLDSYVQAVVKIATTGANLAAATGQFQYSLDGGVNYSVIYAIPTGGTFAVPNTGMTLTFANGAGTGNSFVKDDFYVFSTLPPGFVTGDLTAAVNVAVANSSQFSWLHVIGAASSASGSASIASALASLMDAAETNHQYQFAIMEAADDSDAALEAAFANFVDKRINVAAGYEDLQSTITGNSEKRSMAWGLSARLAKITVSTDPSQFSDGPVSGVNALLRDENVTPGLDFARFSTMRTFPQTAGFYITNGNMMETAGGDFSLVQYIRVMNKACKVAYAALLQFLSTKLRVNPAGVQAPKVPGAIDERDARNIEAQVAFKLNAALTAPGDVVSVSVIVDRTNNILSTKTLNVTIRIVPLGYAKTISATIGFVNPALVLAV